MLAWLSLLLSPLALAAPGPQLSCSAPNPEPATFELVQGLIEKCDLRDFDSLLPLLPKTYRSKTVLMHDSRSQQSASLELPRAVIYGQDASFILTFTGDPSKPDYQQIEMIQFRDTKSTKGKPEFDFRKVTFPAKGSSEKAIVSEKNPAECLTCHRDPPRPNWDSYPLWPGAFGATEDLGQWEVKALNAFAETRKRHPRYKHVSAETKRNSSNEIEVAGPLELTQHLHLKMQQVIAARIKAAPAYPTYRFALMGQLIGCPGWPEKYIPASELNLRGHKSTTAKSYATVSEETQRKLAAYSDGLKTRHGAIVRKRGTEPDRRRPVSAPGNFDYFQAAQFRYLVEQKLGLEIKDWSLARDPDAYAFVSPILYFHDLERIFFDDVKKDAPELVKLRKQRIQEMRSTYLDESSYDSFYGDSYGPRIDVAGSGGKYCEVLEKRSQAAFAKPARKADCAECGKRGAPVTEAAKLGGSLTRVETKIEEASPLALLDDKCSHCHTSGAYAIPFDDPVKLAQALKKPGYPRGTLAQEIVHRLKSTGSDRMPQDDDLEPGESERIACLVGMLATGKTRDADLASCR